MYHVGSCPICGDGLRGIRVCCGELVVVCDECDALWSSPALTDRISTSADPVCSHCNKSLWGDQARWARRQDVETAGWWPDVAGETPPPESPDTNEVESPEPCPGADSPTTQVDSETGLTAKILFALLLVGSLVAALAIL